MFSWLHQYLPVSVSVVQMIGLLMFFRSIHGPSRKRQPIWRLRSRRHDWRISRGYGREMHSRLCWTCRGTFRRNLRSFPVDDGWDCDDRWVLLSHKFPFILEHTANTHRLVTCTSVRELYPCIGGLGHDRGYVIIRNGTPLPWWP